MGLYSYIKSFFSHAPSYSGYLKLGYKARTYNGDFIFTRSYKYCSVNIHQGIEPHNKKLAEWIDFEIDDACVVISLHENESHSRKDVDEIRSFFDFVYERGPHLFCMNRHMDFNDPHLEELIMRIDELLA